MRRTLKPERLSSLLASAVIFASLILLLLLPVPQEFKRRASPIGLAAAGYFFALYILGRYEGARRLRYLTSFLTTLIITIAFYLLRDYLPSLFLLYLFAIAIDSLTWDRQTAIFTAALSSLEYGFVITLTTPLTLNEGLNAALVSIIFFWTAILSSSIFKEEKVRARRLSTLNAIAAAVSRPLELDDLLEAALNKVLEALGFDSGAIYLMEKGNELRVAKAQGLSEELLQVAKGITSTQAARLGAPIITDDLTKEPEAPKEVIEEGFRSLATIPLISKEEVTGVLMVAGRQVRPFGAQDLDLLLSVGHQIGGAMEKVRLYGASQQELGERKRAEEALRRHAEQLEALRQVGMELTAQLDLDALLHSIVSRAVELLAGTAGGLYLYRPERDVLEWAVTVGPNMAPIGTVLRRGEGLSGKVWETGEPLIVDDYQEWEGQAAIYEGYPWTAVVGVPVRWGEKFLGVLNVLRDAPRTFSPAHAELLTLFANRAAIAIENARLYEAERERRREMETLQQAAQALSATLDLQQVFELILGELQQVVPYDSASVQLLRGDRLEIIGGHGFPNLGELLGISFPLDGDNPNRQVMATRAPFIVEDAPAIYSGFREEPHAPAGIHSWLGVPLIFGDRLIGMIALDKRQPGFYTDEHAQLAIAFAAQAAIAIENAELYEEAKRRLTETSALHRVSEVINSTLDLQEIFHRVVEELSKTFGYRLVDIYLLEEKGLTLQANVGYDDGTTIDFIPMDKGVIGRVARTRQPAFVRDVAEDPDYIPSYPDITCEICVPITRGDTLLGILNVESSAQRPLTEDDLQLLHTLSSHIGVAIENARLYEETKHLATTDSITGLYNVRYFYQALEKDIARSERYHHPLSLIIMDIDNFKRYNDTYGHLAGDDLLRELASLLQKITRASDTVARYGGEEFTIILPETDTEGAALLAKRIQGVVRKHPFAIRDTDIVGKITVSLGVATYPHHANSGKELVDAADKALLGAKREGKDRLYICREAMGTS